MATDYRCVCPQCSAYICGRVAANPELVIYNDRSHAMSANAWDQECTRWLGEHICGTADGDGVEDTVKFAQFSAEEVDER